MLTIRSANATDVSFLAHVVYEASLPPENHSFWDDLLQGSSTGAEEFIAAMLKTRATYWSQIDDFMIVEREGHSVAAASIYAAPEEDYRPIRLDQMNQIAQELGWSSQTETAFCDRYHQLFGNDPKPLFFKPQAPWILEYVAVIAEARGLGIG